jgi:hypothetical protein
MLMLKCAGTFGVQELCSFLTSQMFHPAQIGVPAQIWASSVPSLSAGAPAPSRQDTLPPWYYKHLLVEYPQVNKTCLASLFASALHMAGHIEAGLSLQNNIQEGQLEKGATSLLRKFENAVNRSKLRDSSTKQPLFMRRCNWYDIYKGPTPAAVVLQADDCGIGHAVAIYENYIIDSSFPYVLPRNKESLDWCCYPGKYQCPRTVYTIY